MSSSFDNPAPAGRLLTPLGGIGFALLLTLLGFWLPLLSLIL